jgi:tRNA G18 (ribose-2'-O)-methylase SpoU
MHNPGIIPSPATGADAMSDRASATAHDSPGLEFLLYGLQSPINIGMILRIAETYRFRTSIYDQFRVLDDPERFSTIKDFACGAVSRLGFNVLADEAALAQALHGRRLVATSVVPTGCELPDYKFRRGDLFALGNEYDGLPDTIVSQADSVLHIPMPAGWTPKPEAKRPIDPSRTAPVARDGQPNLNVAMTAAILCYAAYVSALGSGHLVESPTPGVEQS